MLDPMSTAIHPGCNYCKEIGFVRFVFTVRSGHFFGIVSVKNEEKADCPYIGG